MNCKLLHYFYEWCAHSPVSVCDIGFFLSRIVLTFLEDGKTFSAISDKASDN